MTDDKSAPAEAVSAYDIAEQCLDGLFPRDRLPSDIRDVRADRQWAMNRIARAIVDAERRGMERGISIAKEAVYHAGGDNKDYHLDAIDKDWASQPHR